MESTDDVYEGRFEIVLKSKRPLTVSEVNETMRIIKYRMEECTTGPFSFNDDILDMFVEPPKNIRDEQED